MKASMIGDNCIVAGFLYGVLTDRPVENCLEEGARIAARVVEVFEPWIVRK